MTPETLAAFVGIILSLAFSYIPGLRAWFDLRTGDEKRMIMGGVIVAASLILFGVACAGFAADFGLMLACTRPDAVRLLSITVMMLVGNQSAYTISK